MTYTVSSGTLNSSIPYHTPFYVHGVLLVFIFCHSVVLVKLSLMAKWLARKTPPRKPNRGEGIISIKPRPKSVYDCVGLVYSFVVLLHDICVLPGPVCLWLSWFVVFFHCLIAWYVWVVFWSYMRYFIYSIRTVSCFTSFRQQLKTHLFRLSFG